MRQPARQWAAWAGVSLALLSGLTALAMLLLPLMLVLLMLLFETTARGVLVLLGLLIDWLRAFMPAGSGGLPPFQAVVFHPLDAALGSLLRALPCLAGLVMLLLDQRPPGWRRSGGWWWITLLWGLAAAVGGRPVAMVLLPGLLIAAIFAMRSGSAVWSGRRRGR